jgi:hypothetical protein
MPELSEIKIWIEEAKGKLGGREMHEELREEPFVYDDLDSSGHLYWWVDGDVASCPVSANGQLDLENVGLVEGGDQGAEYDIYGRECLIVASLAERFGDEEKAAVFRDRALGLFQRAEAEDCLYWPIDERPPVGP